MSTDCLVHVINIPTDVISSTWESNVGRKVLPLSRTATVDDAVSRETLQFSFHNVVNDSTKTGVMAVTIKLMQRFIIKCAINREVFYSNMI